jgi:hypothetical protein
MNTAAAATFSEQNYQATDEIDNDTQNRIRDILLLSIN